ncbi:MAG: SUMF1/EgtB/PvdO family nonheme iron enzyme [Mangrovibacterium sp.]
MKKILYGLLISALTTACLSQTETHEMYLEETSYSDRPSNLTMEVGYQRAILHWTNPKGPVAKKIMIEYTTYGKEVQRIVIDEMVNTQTITGLDSGYGYEFSVYTLDAAGIKSLPVKNNCTPFSAGTVASLEETLIVGYSRLIGGGYALKWDFADNMIFNGDLSYTISASGGFSKSGTEEGGSTETGTSGKVISFFTPRINGLTENTVYELTTTVSVIPSNGEIVCIDAVNLHKTVSFELIAPKYQIAFNTGQGATSIPGQLISPLGYVTIPEAPVHPDKLFMGWRMPSQRLYGEYFDFANSAVESDLTLYAVWVPKSVPSQLLPEMVNVPAGSFTMGDSWLSTSSELPLHQVTLSNFEMSKFEVNQELFKYVSNDYNPADVSLKSGDPIFAENDLPINKCHWFDAVVFCNWLSIINNLDPCYSVAGQTDPRQWGNTPASNRGWTVTCDITRKGYRLPTEAEWEYACGGGGNLIQRDKYAGTNNDDDLPLYAWCASEADGVPHVPGRKRANILGIHDLSGNMMEWCSDSFKAYTAGGSTNPLVMDPAISKQVTRGGSFKWDNDSFCRTSWRDGNNQIYRSGDVGIRLVRTK